VARTGESFRITPGCVVRFKPGKVLRDLPTGVQGGGLARTTTSPPRLPGSRQRAEPLEKVHRVFRDSRWVFLFPTQTAVGADACN
jgi:hypothetical protein